MICRPELEPESGREGPYDARGSSMALTETTEADIMCFVAPQQCQRSNGIKSLSCPPIAREFVMTLSEY